MTKHLTMVDVLEAVDREIAYQDGKWGPDKEQSLAGYLLIMQVEIEAAIKGWQFNLHDRHSALSNVLQTVTVGLRCLQTYGVSGCAQATNDVVPPAPLSFTQVTQDSLSTTIELTSLSGTTVKLEKSMIIDVLAQHLHPGSRVHTRHDYVDVQEDARTIQQMLQS